MGIILVTISKDECEAETKVREDDLQTVMYGTILDTIIFSELL